MAEDRGACFPCSSLPYCPLCRFPGPGGWALPFSLFPTCTQRKAKYRGCEHVPSTGPWEQAEGLSEPSLLLDRCLEEERKAIFTAACPCAPLLPARKAGGWLCAHHPQCLFEDSCPTAGDKPHQPQRPSCQPQHG